MKTVQIPYEIPAHLVCALEYGKDETKLPELDIRDYNDIQKEIALQKKEHHAGNFTWEFQENSFFVHSPNWCSFSCNCVDATLTLFIRE